MATLTLTQDLVKHVYVKYMMPYLPVGLEFRDGYLEKEALRDQRLFLLCQPTIVHCGQAP